MIRPHYGRFHCSRPPQLGTRRKEKTKANRYIPILRGNYRHHPLSLTARTICISLHVYGRICCSCNDSVRSGRSRSSYAKLTRRFLSSSRASAALYVPRGGQTERVELNRVIAARDLPFRFASAIESDFSKVQGERERYVALRVVRKYRSFVGR